MTKVAIYGFIAVVVDLLASELCGGRRPASAGSPL